MTSCKQILPVLCIGLCALAAAGQEISPRSISEMPLDELRATLKGYPGDWRPDTDRARGLPEPPRSKPVSSDAVRISLPAPERGAAADISLVDAIGQRRSHRAFTEEELTTGELGFLLWSAQGVTGQSGDESDRSFRAVPSAGGRYPLETYVLAFRVEGVPAGIHRYRPESHELVTVKTDEDLPATMVDVCYQSAFVGEAAAVVAWAAVPERTEWKYGYLSPRMIAMEAGHACQNLYLACEAVDAGACAMLSYDQARLDALLGVDGDDEFVIYLAVVGKVPR